MMEERCTCRIWAECTDIGGFRLDCYWQIVQVLTLNGQVVFGLADWSRICVFVIYWCIVPGFALDWRCSPRWLIGHVLALDWPDWSKIDTHFGAGTGDAVAEVMFDGPEWRNRPLSRHFGRSL